MTLPTLRAALMQIALGALVGTALDQLHVAGGVLSYPVPFFMGQAIWVPALFAAASVGLGNLHGNFRRFFAGTARGSGAELARDGALFAGAYALTAFLHIHTGVMLLVLTAAYAARVLILKEPTHRLVHAIACAGIGIAAESTLVSAGAFLHHSPDFFGLPWWLPGLYLHAAPFMGGVDDALERATAAAPQAVTSR